MLCYVSSNNVRVCPYSGHCGLQMIQLCYVMYVVTTLSLSIFGALWITDDTVMLYM